MPASQSLLKKFFIHPNKPLKDAMKLIDSSGQKMAIVVDAKRKLKGVITDGDIRRGILSGKSIDEQIKSVMNTHPIVIKNDVNKKKLSSLLMSQKVKEKLWGDEITRLPVIDNTGNVVDVIFISGNHHFFLSNNISLKTKIKPVKRVLIIGGAGYVGSILVRKLLKRNYYVNILDNFTYGKESICAIKNKKLKIFTGDSRHLEDVVKAIKGVDAVVHLAELVGDPASALKPTLTQEINYLAIRSVAETLKHFQINRFIYLSSCSVYGASYKEELLTEESRLNPVSLYAKMKIASESALQEIAGANDNFAPTILRSATVFGASYRPRFDLVVNLLTAKALGENFIEIFGGDQWRPNIHVSDLSKAIIKTLEAPIEKVKGEIFNVGGNGLNFKIKDIGEKVLQHIPKAKMKLHTSQTDARNYKVDFSRIQKKLNFLPLKTIDDGIEEIIHLVNSNNLVYEDNKYSNLLWLKSKISEKMI